MDHFYLKDIELQNFRKFDNAVYKLNPHMNVFIGRNASGKNCRSGSGYSYPGRISGGF